MTACMNTLIKNEINGEVFHGRIHKFFDRLGCPVDFVDKQNITIFKMGENSHQIAAFFEGGSRGPQRAFPRKGCRLHRERRVFEERAGRDLEPVVAGADGGGPAGLH